MEISELRGTLPNEIIESITGRGIKNLTPPQEEAIKKGLVSGNNIVIASPTASGKTLIAEIACVNNIIAKGKKSVYIAPMKALVSEKYDEFKKAYPYIKSAISLGNLDSNDPWLSTYDMIFVSTEKFDSLMRHSIEWLLDVGCVVFDEIHMMGEFSRGPTLELLVTKIKEFSNIQIIALSATIGNAGEIAEWLNAEIVQSDFRPVKLKMGVVYGNAVHYREKQKKAMHKEMLAGSSPVQELRIVEDTLLKNKQVLLFYSTRKHTEYGAKRISDTIKKILKEDERSELKRISNKILNSLAVPTEQCISLSRLVMDGVAFHHAGLLPEQRAYVEEAFKSNVLKAICATTTLSLGVNMPAHTVLVKDVYRYNGDGSVHIGINEVMQLFGRAGRPKYDTEGRALLIASSNSKIKELFEEYIDRELDPINSSMGVTPILRMHILAFIAENFINNEEEMKKFIARTFYGYQYGDIRTITENIETILEEQTEWGFIKKDGNIYTATPLGKRISELYIDPLSAKWIVEALKSKRDIMSNLFMIANTLEMRPYVKATEEALAEYVNYKNTISEELLKKFEFPDYGLYEPDKAFSTALMFHDWIEEVKEVELQKKYSVPPGVVYTKITNADWLIYSSIEIAKVLHIPTRDLLNVSIRLKYGIKEELLDLVRLEQIGRVRARILFNNGIKTVADIRKNREKTEKLLGNEIAKAVFRQLE